MRSTDRDEALKRSKFAVFSDTGRFLKGPTLAKEKIALQQAAESHNVAFDDLIDFMLGKENGKSCSPCAQHAKIQRVVSMPENAVPWERIPKRETPQLLEESPQEITITWDDPVDG